MIRDTVSRASGVAQLVAAGLFAVIGARFGTAGVLFAIAERAPKLEVTADAPPAPPPKASSAPPAPAPTGEVAKSGTTLRLQIVVTAGSDRSELRVDGVKVGNTPYVGEITCKAGERIKIDLLPPKGMPTTHEKTCAPGTLRIGD